MKIPKKAKRVFKGKIYDIYQWPQKMFDGRTDTFEMLKRPDTVIIFAETEKKIIVQKQKQPHTKWFYCMPAGRVDKAGESAKQAAARELLEETGYASKTLKLFLKLNPSHHMDHTVYVFFARGCKKIADLQLDGGEKIINELHSFDDFLKLWKIPTFLGGDARNIIIKANLDQKYRKALKKALVG